MWNVEQKHCVTVQGGINTALTLLFVLLAKLNNFPNYFLYRDCICPLDRQPFENLEVNICEIAIVTVQLGFFVT